MHHRRIDAQEIFHRFIRELHARNHAAFWDGQNLTLTPAYDICPQNRTGSEASQAMLIKGDARASTLATCLNAAPDYHLNDSEAAALIEQQIESIAQHWPSICDDADLSPVDRKLFAGRQFLNLYALEGLDATRHCTTPTGRLTTHSSGRETEAKAGVELIDYLKNRMSMIAWRCFEHRIHDYKGRG